MKGLYIYTTGSYNIAQGYNAGYNLTTGSYNIDIGNEGVAAESNSIRIGDRRRCGLCDVVRSARRTGFV